MAKTIDLGAVSAYALAVKYGYQGTEEEWVQEIQKFHDDAHTSAQEASENAADAAGSAAIAADKAAGVKLSAAIATDKAADAAASAVGAAGSAADADIYAKKAKSYAVGTGGEAREGDDADCTLYYYEQVKRISQELNGNWNNIADTYLAKTGDSKDAAVTFNSGDSLNPTGWADVGLIASGEKHSSLFRKFSLFAKNVRYIWKLMGNTSLSDIGNGTITGAISAVDKEMKNRGLADSFLEHKSINNTYTVNSLLSETKVTFFTNWTDNANFPMIYGSGIMIPAIDQRYRFFLYISYNNTLYYGCWLANAGIVWKAVT